MYGGVQLQLYAALDSTLNWSERSASRPTRFTPRKRTPSI